ncbi:MAG: hypothetical protein V3V49_07890 [Candidatus Krumholzibacteria bacterium]
MKQTLLCALILVLLPQLAAAQLGTVCLFSDQNGSDCSLSDTAPGLLTVYVIHTFVPGATAVQFSAPKPSCMVGATWISDTWPFPVTIGDSQSDVAIGYGGCLTGTVHVLSINYSASGTTTADCPYKVLPATGQFEIQAVDCDNNQVTANGGTTYINSSIACECSGTLPAPPVLAVTPLSLDFGMIDSVMTLQVSNIGGSTLSWLVYRSPTTWISVSPISGVDNGSITVTVNRVGLPPGTHTGVVNVVSNGGVINVPVSLTMAPPPPALLVNPSSLDFGTTATLDQFTIFNNGGPTLTWNITNAEPWLVVLPSSGTETTTINATVDRTGLSLGAHGDTIKVTSNGGNANILVAMTVLEPAPVLTFTPPSLSFPMGVDSLPLDIMNVGLLDLLWDIASDQPWLSVQPAAGTNDTQVMVRVDRTGLADGTFNGNLSITSNGGSGTVPVSITVVNPAPILGFTPLSLSFPVGTDSLALFILNDGPLDLFWNITPDQPWLTVDPASGTNDTPVAVEVDRAGLADGTFNGNLSITSNGGSGTVPVTLTVATVPVLWVSTSQLSFTSSTTVRSFAIQNRGVGTLSWSLSADQSWIHIDPPLSGSGATSVTVRVNPDSVPAGDQQLGNVTVDSNGGTALIAVSFSRAPTGVAGVLGLYGDPSGTDCNIVDQTPGLVNVFIVHQYTTGATAVQFSAPMPSCWAGATYLSDVLPFPLSVGNSQTGISLAYGACLVSPITVMSIAYFGTGIGTPCCEYPVLPDPSVPEGQILVTDCGFTNIFGLGAPGYINANATCPCGLVTSVHEMTWGHIKALYHASEATTRTEKK